MIIKVKENIVCEGIDINPVRHVVSYNAKHQDNVNTSVEDNPTVDTTTIPGVEIWSIFSRNRVDTRDGNPLVYALKGERGWKFRSEWDRKEVLKQFNLIADKFLATHKYDVTIIAPTSNPLNDFIVNTIVSKDPDIEYIQGVLLKLTTGDIRAMVDEKGSRFIRAYRNEIDDAFRRLEVYLERMDRERNGVFTRHLVDDDRMRNVLDRTLKNNDGLIAEDAAKITDHDVLIVDDTISRGQTVKEAVKTIRACYAPKSVTVLTLFSKLYA